MGPLTLGHYYATGVQDCGNAFSYDEEFLPDDKAIAACPRAVDVGIIATQAVIAVTSQWVIDDFRNQGEYDPAELEGLDPAECFAQWRAGWTATAIRYVIEHAIARWNRMCPVCGGIQRGNTCCP